MAGNTDLFEIMQTMRAMRRLKPDPVPQDLVWRIVEAGSSSQPIHAHETAAR